MARPRIFVSSTYYDLKHLRSAIERFVESLGFDAVLSEKGAIAYSPDVPLDESCYREVRNSDVFVLVVGGRYGSQSSGENRVTSKTFFERYDSVTKQEFKAAVERDIPIYVFIERNVYAEYQTFLRNKSKTDIAYAHVDSINVFHLIDDILGQPRNNPVREFDRYEDIEHWLRDQWAGLFKDPLQKSTERKQIEDLKTQVENVTAISNALKSYLEEVVQKVLPQQAENLIKNEERKLEQARFEIAIRQSPFIMWLYRTFGIKHVDAAALLRNAKDFNSLYEKLCELVKNPPDQERVRGVLLASRGAQMDANSLRAQLGLPELPITASEPAIKRTPLKKRPGKVGPTEKSQEA